MTSNIGAHLIQEKFENINDKNRDAVIANTKTEVYDLLKKTIRPEFLNRIDEVIMFNPLTRDQIKDIVRILFNQAKVMLAKNDIHLTITDKAIEWLSELGYDPQFGARPLKRVLQKKIFNELSKQILAGTVNKEDVICIDLDKNKHFVFINEKVEHEVKQ